MPTGLLGVLAMSVISIFEILANYGSLRWVPQAFHLKVEGYKISWGSLGGGETVLLA